MTVTGASLSVRSLVVRYGLAVAVDGATFDIAPRSTTCLVGRNGAGKSSIVQAVVGLLPHGGTVTVDGEPLPAGKPRAASRSGVVLVPERRALFPSLTVEDNLLLGGYTRRMRATQLRRCDEIELVYELFPILREFRGRPAGALSGGQQQMVAIGRGLMTRPRVLLLDEPSLGLAPQMVETIYDAVHRLVTDGLSVLVVEENPERALQAAQRVVVLEVGTVTFTGTVDELRRSSVLSDAYLGAAGEGRGEPVGGPGPGGDGRSI